MSGGTDSLQRLLGVMRRLRDPQSGCPWDLEQTFASIAPFTVEEAYEVADAIESGDPQRIREELGDLLFQVVFHARLAEERGWFDFEAVARAIEEKLVRRHPHVFGGARVVGAAALNEAWERTKAAERAARGDASHLADVPRGLPALTRSRKLGKRAAQLHFDFADAPAARAKIDEELAELDALVAQPPTVPATDAAAAARERVADELGDVLFAVTNWGRHLGLDAEECLRGANAKFERRFRRMELLAGERGQDLATLDAAGWDALWVAAKAATGGSDGPAQRPSAGPPAGP